MASMLHNDDVENRKNMRCGRVDVEQEASERRQSDDRSMVVEESDENDDNDDDGRNQRKINKGESETKRGEHSTDFSGKERKG